tara:strand:- start:722 stop:1168 length:447 start_codon:yes stop_codon:yes gene_type:complete
MAITFTWTVKEMHKVTATGAVNKVEWSCMGVDEDTEVSHSRSGTHMNMGEVTTNEVVGYTDKVTGKDSDGKDIIERVPVTEDVTRVVPVTPDHTADDFVAYDKLDEATVLGWCKANGVKAYNEGLITKNITNKIAAQVNSTGIPWAAE